MSKVADTFRRPSVLIETPVYQCPPRGALVHLSLNFLSIYASR